MTRYYPTPKCAKQFARGLALSIALCALPGLAQETPTAPAAAEAEPTLHWAYASYFGTGRYQINDQQGAYVINASAAWKEGDLDWSLAADQQSHYELKVPITIGLAQFGLDDIEELVDLGNLSIGSVGLSANIDVPVTEHISVRPNIQVGHGRVLSTGEYAWTYRGDVRARYRFDWRTFDLSLIGAMGAVGYDPNVGAGDGFVFTELGVEAEVPVSWFAEEGKQSLLHPYIKYTQLPLDLEVQRTATSVDSTSNIIDLGIAFGRKNEPLKLWFLEFNRIGLAITGSPGSDLRGIKLVVNSLYEP